MVTKALKKQAKKYNIKLTVKRKKSCKGYKRVYKSEKELKKQIQNAKKRKLKSKFGSAVVYKASILSPADYNTLKPATPAQMKKFFTYPGNYKQLSSPVSHYSTVRTKASGPTVHYKKVSGFGKVNYKKTHTPGVMPYLMPGSRGLNVYFKNSTRTKV